MRDSGAMVREIPRWVDAYARNRRLSSAVRNGVILLVAVAATATGRLFGRGLAVSLCVCVAYGVADFLSLTMMMDWVLDRWMFRHQGSVETRIGPIPPIRMRHVALLGVMPVALLAFLAAMAAGIPPRYYQPVSAVCYFSANAAVFAWWPFRAPLASWVFNALYMIHAALLVAGAPIVFEGDWKYMNLMAPWCGYSMVSGLAGHLWSRYALRKLRQTGAA